MIYSTAARTVSTFVSPMSRAALCALLGLCLLVGLRPRAAALSASTFVVTRTADDTLPGSLRSAIALAAASGGTVTFAIPASDPGYNSAASTDTITLALGPLIVPASLSIVGPTAPSATVVVSGAVAGSLAQSRVFTVTGGTVAFSNLTITNGSAIQGGGEPEGGGGILNTATLTLTGCVITGNTSNDLPASGGGVNNSGPGASLTLTDCTISQNSGTFGNSGGVGNSGTLTATGCLLSGNSVGGNFASGAGLANTGTATLNTCTLSGNSASPSGIASGAGGGGAYNTGGLTLNSCLIDGNGTIVSGGGINNSGGTLTLSACTISGNSAGRGFNNNGIGGGIYSTGTAQMTNCLVVNNIGASVAGMFNGGILTLINSTFTGNATYDASGFTGVNPTGGLASGPATLVNDIFYFDTTYHIGVTTPSEIITISGNVGPTVTFSDVQGGYTGTGNIALDPQFVRNPSPALNTPADPGDEHLKLSSPAVHTGTNGQGVPLTDIEGTIRPVPPATPSMGAYEVPGSASGFSAQGGFAVTGAQNVSIGSQVVAKFLPGTTAPASFTATVDFGDGSSLTAGTISPDPTATSVLQVTGSHTYTGYGAFTITVVISGPGGTPTATVTSTATIQPAQVAVDVTSQVSVFRGGMVYNRATKRYVQTVTITNNTGTAITGPLSLVLDTLTPGATVATGIGTTQYVPPAGSPYQNASATSIAPGASISLVVQLTYAGTDRLNYSPRVLAGPGAR